jgi:hypothetical protein
MRLPQQCHDTKHRIWASQATEKFWIFQRHRRINKNENYNVDMLQKHYFLIFLVLVFIIDVTVSSSHTHFYFLSMCCICLTIWHMKEMWYYVYKNLITHLFGFSGLILKFGEAESRIWPLRFSTPNSVSATWAQVSNSVTYFQLPSAYFSP